MFCFRRTNRILFHILKEQIRMSIELDNLTTQVTSTLASEKAAVDKILALLAAPNTDPVALNALTTALKTSQTALDAAVASTTPPPPPPGAPNTRS